MAPKKKNAPRKELTADDMRRLGMNEEDISRILAERGKSADERRQDTETMEARRREQDLRHKRLKELERLKAVLVHEEGGPRGEIRGEEDAAWSALEETLVAQKKLRLREFADHEAHQRLLEAKRRRAAEFEAYQESLSHLTPEEREAFIAKQIKAEQERCEEELRKQEAERERLERKAAREKARKAMQRRNKNEDEDDDSDTDEVKVDMADRMADAVVSRYD